MDVKKDKKIDNSSSLSTGDPENTTDISIFSNDYMYSFVHKKAEKLASAVYMVTNFIPEDEPLRIRLRKKSLYLLSVIMSLLIGHSISNTKTSKGHIFIETITSAIIEIVALLEIARASGHLSEMNFNILHKEYIALGNLLRTKGKEIITGKIQIPSNFFDIPKLHMAESKLIRQGNKNIFKSGERAYTGGSLKRQQTARSDKKDIIKRTSANIIAKSKSA